MIPTLWIDAASSLTSPALALGLSGDGTTESTATIRTAVSSTATTSLHWPDHPAHRQARASPPPDPTVNPWYRCVFGHHLPSWPRPRRASTPRGLKTPGGMAQPWRR